MAATMSAVDQVVGQVRDLIRDRSLKIGDVLPTEAELSEMFGAGRNTVREAVRTLKAYGILESRQKVGAVIIDQSHSAAVKLFSYALDISTESFRDIQGYRRLTEMHLFDGLMKHMTEQDFEAMEQANSEMVAAADVVEASSWDYRFHQSLVDAARNNTLSELYRMMRPVICRLMEVGKVQRSAREGAASEHEDILSALRERSAIDFAYHMNRHLDAGLVFLPDGPTTSEQTAKEAE
ncbi:FadR/GntR family transcriptional regulator [Oceaniglobus trochenteri]|uniref:FadR/GntR family transcriptional regulator n=1 Tax=Oceaniglobus trochenteri TaxID=2763260 RepID=UPI001CFF6E98|nr:GntR family transcriptional regulator [Oceaniglobus trochenteri]